MSNHASATCIVFTRGLHASDIRVEMLWKAKSCVSVHLIVCDPSLLLKQPKPVELLWQVRMGGQTDSWNAAVFRLVARLDI